MIVETPLSHDRSGFASRIKHDQTYTSAASCTARSSRATDRGDLSDR
jgi:hypothetical protein